MWKASGREWLRRLERTKKDCVGGRLRRRRPAINFSFLYCVSFVLEICVWG